MKNLYTEFEPDCKEIFGKYLANFGFSQKKIDRDSLEMLYQNQFWGIRITMLSNFPHVGVSFGFESLSGEVIKSNILNKALFVDSSLSQKILRNYFDDTYHEKSSHEKYKIEMRYCVEVIDTLYKSLLIGDFTYLKYQTLLSSSDTGGV